MIFKDANFKQLFELSGDAMMVLGESRFVYCNAAALDIFNCPSVDEFITKHPADLSPRFQPCGASSKELAQIHIQEAIAKGYKRFEWVHQRLTNEDFFADVLLSVGVWEDKPIIQAIVRDISGYKAVQNILRRQKNLADQAAKAKAEFLAVMSHEIRTPIHGILGAQDLLLETKLDDEQRGLAELVGTSSKRLLTIVNDVLDFSKIDAGKLDFEIINFSARGLVLGMHELFRISAEEKAIDLTVEADHEDVYLLGDPARIQQIITNLVSNAIKFTSPGGRVKLNSKLDCSDCGEAYDWSITVSDNGIGMTDEQQETVFDIFTQADSSITRSYGGTGLGLSISKLLAEKMGGGIKLKSQFGDGSSFTLQLSLKQGGAPPDLDAGTKPVLHRDYQAAVLVAEDNTTNQLILRRKLQKLGVSSVVVCNGLEVLQEYESSLNSDGSSPYALLLMDIQMPLMNGIEAARELRQRGCTLPVIALTADAQVERKQQCLAAGMQAFVSKPYEIERLIKLFDSYLVP